MATTSAVNPAHLHLLRRATFGPTPASITQLERMGTRAWLDAQLRPSAMHDPLGDNLVKRFPRLALSIRERRARLTGAQIYGCVTDLTALTIGRSVWSSRQLHEMVVSMWADHFSVTNGSELWDCRSSLDHDVVRPHSLGRFDQLLQGVTMHPAMLRFLAADLSTASAPNENLGRELLELHTVGLAAGFTEADVRSSARVLTGLSVGPDGTFLYRPASHYVGPVRVLGWSSANDSPAGGLAVAKSYLHYLAHHPATARNVAHRLAVRFVRDTPSPSLIEHLARHYLASGTRIDVVLRALFASSDFAHSHGAKVKRPFEDIASTYRVLGAPPASHGTTDLEKLIWISAESGNQPLSWPQPNGFPDTADAWASPSAQVARWTMHYNAAAAGWTAGLRAPTVKSLLPGRLPHTWGELTDALVHRLTWTKPSRAHRSALLSYMGRTNGQTLDPHDYVLGGTLSEVLTLILGSPYFQVR